MSDRYKIRVLATFAVIVAFALLMAANQFGVNKVEQYLEQNQTTISAR